MKIFLLALKIAITGGISWLLLRRVDIAPIGHFLSSSEGLMAMGASVGILLVQALLAALRFQWIMRLMDSRLSFMASFWTWMTGLIVSQTLITFIAGDAARIWQLIRRHYPRRTAAASIFLERALGFAVLMAMTMALLPALFAKNPGPAETSGLLVIAGLCGVGIAGFIASGFLNHLMIRVVPRLALHRIGAALVDIASAARHLRNSPKHGTAVVGMSAVMHLCNVAAFYALGLAAGVDLDLVSTTVIVLPIMLIALMPIALAGWGVREGAAVVGYGLLGVDAETAVTISVAFGLALLIASLPGGIFLLFNSRPVLRTANAEAGDNQDSVPA